MILDTLLLLSFIAVMFGVHQFILYVPHRREPEILTDETINRYE